MKTIFVEPAWKSPISVQSLVANSPKGYRFVALEDSEQALFKSFAKYNISYKLLATMGNFISIQLLKSEFGRLKHPPAESILTYSLHHLILRKEPWVLDLTTELPYILAWTERHLENNKKRIESILSSNLCRKIICQVSKGKEAVLATFGDKFCNKVEVVPRSVPVKNFQKIAHSEKVRLLFVNSGNINTDLHFFGKGGAEVVESFKILSKKYNNLELVIRSGMPENLKEQYTKLKNIHVFDKPILFTELNNLWETSDIFVLPNHYNTSAQVFLDAMSYGLPVVTTDTWANSEFVTEAKTGFLVHNLKAARFTEGPLLHLNSAYMKEIVKKPSQEVITGLVDKLSILIDDSNLRKRMGQKAKDEIDSGRFSLEKVNQKMKSVLDEATECNEA
jgi:glycosyltransferase involved in cell wall biosynthesis